MSFRTVFMAVGAGQGDAEVDRAVTICNALGAHLSLLVLGIAPPPPASPYGVVSNDIWAGDIRQGQEDAATRAQAIEARLAGSDLSSLVSAQYIDRGTRRDAGRAFRPLCRPDADRARRPRATSRCRAG